MTMTTSEDLRLKRVVSQDGHHIGEVENLEVDMETWHVRSISVKVRRDVLDALQLVRPFFGTQTIKINVDQIAGVSDTMVLRTTLDTLEFEGGKTKPSNKVPDDF